MEQIVVYKKDGSSFNLMRKDPVCTVTTAVQNLSYMSDDYVQLSIKSTEELNFSYGDKIIVYGREYWLRSEVSVDRAGEDLFVYDAQFMGVLYELLKSQYRNTDVNGYAPSSAFDLTGTLRDFIRLIPFNTNRDFAGLWVFDEVSCPETEALTLSFSKENCLAVLQRVVQEFDQEFIIDQDKGIRTIKIGKFGHVINPPSGNAYFEYGKGKGLYNLKLQKVDDKSVITRLWAEGGTNNIKSDYRGYSQRLQLPLSKIGSEDKRYVEDNDLKQQLGDSIEDTEFFDEIFPKRLGTVTTLGDTILSFYDSTMDFNLNERDSQGNTKWLVDGVSAKIIFNSGALAGQEFELSKYDHSTKKFTILEFTDSRGLKFPNPNSDAFRIGEGDTYKITDITLPDQYVVNAENELWDAAVEKLNDRKQPRVQYVQTFDKMYFSNYLPTDAIANVFMPGDFVPVKDDRIGVEKNIQIQKVTRNILADYDYTLQLSDITAINVLNQTITDVIDHERVIENNRLRDYNKARRGWRTTEELRTMVYDPDGYFDAENIRPNSIDTNMLSVGAKSQQFILEGVILQANYNGVANAFNASSGTLVHLAIEETIRIWNLSGVTYSMTNTEGYYVFAKCSKIANTGVFIVTQTRYMVENTMDPNNYYFQVGIIGSLHSDSNFRDFITTHGFTRINGHTITTGRIESSGGGSSYFDLDSGEMLITRAGVGNSRGVNVGLNGLGTDREETRIWAGATVENRDNAPYRILDNGKSIQKDAVIYGSIAIKAIHINANNFYDYFDPDGTYGPTIRISEEKGFNFSLDYLPASWTSVSFPREAKYEGVEIGIFNNTTQSIQIVGYVDLKQPNAQTTSNLGPQSYARFLCVDGKFDGQLYRWVCIVGFP